MLAEKSRGKGAHMIKLQQQHLQKIGATSADDDKSNIDLNGPLNIRITVTSPLNV